MNRRHFLATAAIIVPTGIAGCSGSRNGSSLPDGMTVETHHQVGSHLKNAGIGPSGERPRSYQTLITNRSAAKAGTTDEEEIGEFVQETDFNQSYLVVVVAAAWPSGYWLALRSIERADSGLKMAIQTDTDGAGDDAAVHTLFVRITDGRSGVPEWVEVEINGEVTGTVTGS